MTSTKSITGQNTTKSAELGHKEAMITLGISSDDLTYSETLCVFSARKKDFWSQHRKLIISSRLLITQSLNMMRSTYGLYASHATVDEHTTSKV